MGDSTDAPELSSEQAVANKWNQLRGEINQLFSKITELELELSEHNLVIGAIEPMEQSRRCYRMLGGVLVERTVGEVLPAVRRNSEGLKQIVQRLTGNLRTKKLELADLEAKYNIRIRKGNDAREGERKEGGPASQGVLVGPVGSEQ